MEWPQPGYVLYIAVLISITFFVLKKTLFLPLMEIMERREREMESGARRKEEAERRVQEETARYEEQLLEAKRKGLALKEEQRRKSDEAVRATLAAVQDQMREKLTDALADLDRETAAARGKLESEIKPLARGIAARFTS